MAFLSPKAKEFVQRILTNNRNTNPRAIVHNDRVYAVTDYQPPGDPESYYALWTQHDLEERNGCHVVKRSDYRWVETAPPYVKSVFPEEDFQQEDIEAAIYFIAQ